MATEYWRGLYPLYTEWVEWMLITTEARSLWGVLSFLQTPTASPCAQTRVLTTLSLLTMSNLPVNPIISTFPNTLEANLCPPCPLPPRWSQPLWRPVEGLLLSPLNLVPASLCSLHSTPQPRSLHWPPKSDYASFMLDFFQNSCLTPWKCHQVLL